MFYLFLLIKMIQVFDPNLKKKKKKTVFNLDAALNEENNSDNAAENIENKDSEEFESSVIVDEQPMDLENFGKKKKKKKKVFNLDELENVLPETKKEVRGKEIIPKTIYFCDIYFQLASIIYLLLYIHSVFTFQSNISFGKF